MPALTLNSIIEFPNMAEAEDAISRLRGLDIRGVPVKLDFAPVSNFLARNLRLSGSTDTRRKAEPQEVVADTLPETTTDDHLPLAETMMTDEVATVVVTIDGEVMEGMTDEEAEVGTAVTTDEVVEAATEATIDEEVTVGIRPDEMIGTTTVEMIDLLVETMIETGAPHEGPSENVTMIEATELLLPKPAVTLARHEYPDRHSYSYHQIDPVPTQYSTMLDYELKNEPENEIQMYLA